MTEPVLPEQTNDDTDAGWGDPPEQDDDNVRRLEDERPPHYE